MYAKLLLCEWKLSMIGLFGGPDNKKQITRIGHDNAFDLDISLYL